MMEIDLLLPSSLFAIITLSLLLYKKIGDRVKDFLKDRKISIREAVIMVIIMGGAVTAISLMPINAIQILFIAALSYTLMIFTYLVLRRIFSAVIPPIIFILIYLLAGDILVTNIFTGVFAIIAITLLASLFSLRTILAFAGLLAVMDFIQVFITGHMVEAATKIVSLRLPVLLSLQAYPSTKFYVSLGLGDIFLSGLLSIQTASKYNFKAGFISAITISIAFLVFEALIFNFRFNVRGFPATFIVLLGWLLGIGFYLLKKVKGLGC